MLFTAFAPKKSKNNTQNSDWNPDISTTSTEFRPTPHETDTEEDEQVLDDIAIFIGQKSPTDPKIRCPLTKLPMHDPVIYPKDGATYERKAITKQIFAKFRGKQAKSLIRTLISSKKLKAKTVQATQEF